jgi:hypothetical protein
MANKVASKKDCGQQTFLQAARITAGHEKSPARGGAEPGMLEYRLLRR